MVQPDGVDVRVHILYTYTPQTDFQAYYDKLKLKYRSNPTF